MRTGMREVWGILLLVACLLMFLSLVSYRWQDIRALNSPPNDPPHNFIGRAGAWFSFCALMGLGVGAYLLPAVGLFLGLLLMSPHDSRFLPRLGWSLVALLAAASLLELRPEWWRPACERLNLPAPGGVVGRQATRPFLWLLKETGTAILAGGVLACSLVMLVGRASLRAAGARIKALTLAAVRGVSAAVDRRRERRATLEKEARDVEKERKRLEAAMRREERLARVRPEPAAPPEPERPRVAPPPAPAPPPPKPRESAKPPPAPAAREEAAGQDTPDFADYRLPPLTLLHGAPAGKQSVIKGDLQTTSRILKETLEEFGIETEITNVEQGPVVTRYELLPAPGVRVERIAGLSNNLALNLKATSVRVQAPIPGKGVVGIEVPNMSSSVVVLKQVLSGEKWRDGRAELPLALGQDVGGNDIVADLADMPHLLIAGATGSGKTVCINSVLAGLLMSLSPARLRLMLIDPKIVELSVYNDLPHLVVPVITDSKKVPLGLRWAINEMESRYKLFAKVGVRNITGYNQRPVLKQEELFEAGAEEKDDQPPRRLPYVVIVIDELADLMLVAQAEIEHAIARLAQLSRAVGIHMILATQRPSVNVITGTIKANFPARIAFQVAQKVDSRTILDTIGADKLLGRGDMLFLPPGSSKLVRAQGALTSDEEIRALVQFIKKQATPNYEISVKERMESKTAVIDEADDEMLEMAVEVLRETQKASTSSLQRRLRIGYNRAARIMDILEEKGIVGPSRGSEPREILIDLDGEIPDNRGYEEPDQEQ
ncbi:MAG: DNA translocase FtsK [Kiritimatiellae bacterium]|nr:DNA translocase FtsK [Kiritimatiellia bacterium]